MALQTHKRFFRYFYINVRNIILPDAWSLKFSMALSDKKWSSPPPHPPGRDKRKKCSSPPISVMRFPPTDFLLRFPTIFRLPISFRGHPVDNLKMFFLCRRTFDSSAYRCPSEISAYRRPSEDLPTSF